MALQVISPAVSVYKVLAVKDGVEQTEEHIFKRGELLPDWVSSHQQFVLTTTGMARQVGDFPDPTVQRPEQVPAPTVLPEHDPRSVLGSEVTGPKQVTAQADAEADGADLPDLPADGDNKPVWEDYAVDHCGMSRGRAESLKKADLMAEVKDFHAAAKGA
jgi:hypothetical protein